MINDRLRNPNVEQTERISLSLWRICVRIVISFDFCSFLRASANGKKCGVASRANGRAIISMNLLNPGKGSLFRSFPFSFPCFSATHALPSGVKVNHFVRSEILARKELFAIACEVMKIIFSDTVIVRGASIRKVCKYQESMFSISGDLCMKCMNECRSQSSLQVLKL